MTSTKTGTGMTSTRTGLIVCQDPSVTGTLMTSTRTDLIDHRNPGNPETGTTAEMIERGDLQNLGDQVTRLLHLRHPLHHQPDRHGKDDPDMDWLPSPPAT